MQYAKSSRMSYYIRLGFYHAFLWNLTHNPLPNRTPFLCTPKFCAGTSTDIEASGLTLKAHCDDRVVTVCTLHATVYTTVSNTSKKAKVCDISQHHKKITVGLNMLRFQSTIHTVTLSLL